MCGPSGAMKSINSAIQSFSSTVQSEAGQVFGAASSVFNGIMDAVSGIVKGGPSQFGYSEGEYNAKNAAAINAGAAEARNLKGAAASATAAVGGGNTATEAGFNQTATMSADQKAAADTAAAENEILASGFETGRENYNNAVAAEEKAPGVFEVANEANKNVSGAQDLAEKSQQNIDTQSNWAMNDIMKIAPAAIGAVTGGIGNLGDGSFMDNLSSFGAGMFGQTTGPSKAS